MTATLEQLVQVRSQLAEDLLAYYDALIDKLDRAPWPRKGEFVRASEIAVPARVQKEDTRTPPAFGRGREDESERRRGAGRNDVDPEIAALYEEPANSERTQVVAWSVEQRRVKRAVIVGAPGGGKSFLTWTTVVEIANDARRQLLDHLAPLDGLALPLHFELEDLAEERLPPDPADALMELLGRQYKPSALFAAWVREKLKTGQCWLVLDALDQVDERKRPHLMNRLKVIETQGWRSRVILTCRTANYDRARIPWSRVTEYELDPFTAREKQHFIEKWFGQNDPRGGTLRRVLERSYSLNHACRIPLVLTLACLVHEENEITEGMRRVDLYSRMLRGLAGRVWREDKLDPHDAHIDDLMDLLTAIAPGLFQLRPASNQFTNSEIMAAINGAPNRPLPEVLLEQMKAGQLNAAVLAYAPTMLRDELLKCGILVGAGLSKSGETQFSFTHRTFLEYLCACGLARRGWESIEGLIERKSWAREWEEVVVMLAGRMVDPVPLLKLLRDPTRDDIFRHRLCLAVRCLIEV